jgi:parvulin-like peptidyl-prolyl isomerase
MTQENTAEMLTENSESPTGKPTSSVSSGSNSFSNKISSYIKNNPQNVKRITAGVIMVGLLAFLFYKGLFVVAFVNGEPVYRHRIINVLEGQYGKQTVDSEVTQILIRQELDTKGVTVTQEEFDQEMADVASSLSEQGQTLDDYLSYQGISQETFQNELLLSLRIRKLFESEVQVSDEEVASYIEQNQAFLPEETDTTTDEFKASVKDQLTSQKINEKVSQWIDGLRNNASIRYFKTY